MIGILKSIAAAMVAFIALQSYGLAGEVDVQLVLAADVSRSMTIDERLVQRNGYVAAFRHPELLSAVLSGARGRIAVTYVEWAGSAEQAIVVPWMIIGDSASAEAFAHRLEVGPTGSRGSRTSISGALLFAARQFAFSGVTSLRKVIDVSGDGVNDQGPPIAWVREVVTGQGITVNGLSIRLPDTENYGPFAYIYRTGDADLHAYYEGSVIGGPGAFAIAIDDPKDFPPAIRRKLVVEIAGRQQHPVALTSIDAISHGPSALTRFLRSFYASKTGPKAGRRANLAKARAKGSDARGDVSRRVVRPAAAERGKPCLAEAQHANGLRSTLLARCWLLSLSARRRRSRPDRGVWTWNWFSPSTYRTR